MQPKYFGYGTPPNIRNIHAIKPNQTFSSISSPSTRRKWRDYDLLGYDRVAGKTVEVLLEIWYQGSEAQASLKTFLGRSLMKRRQSKTPERQSLGEWFLKCKPQVQIMAIICATALLAWMLAHPLYSKTW